MFGRMLNETIGKLHFWIHVRRRLLHLHAHAFPGTGRPSAPLRRYLPGVNFLAPLHSVHYFITIAAMITITAQLIFLFNFFYSMKAGKERRRESLERHHARMDYSLAAAVR